MKHAPGVPDSVHLSLFPEPGELTLGLTEAQRQQAQDWTDLLPLRDQVLKALDSARQDKVIGASLEAAVTLTASGDLYQLLRKHAADLPAWFIVSQLDLLEGEPGAEPAVTAERARGDKCERCWKYKLNVGSVDAFPTVCADCAAVLRDLQI
jgi:isoleucyl-tRNA synthetase